MDSLVGHSKAGHPGDTFSGTPCQLECHPDNFILQNLTQVYVTNYSESGILFTVIENKWINLPYDSMIFPDYSLENYQIFQWLFQLLSMSCTIVNFNGI